MSSQASAATMASIAAIRAHFPALERVHLGQSVAYFDGPGGTQVPHQVAEAMTDYLYRQRQHSLGLSDQ